MSQSTLEIKKEERDGVTVVHLAGPVDSATIDTFKSKLSRIFRPKGSRIAIDAGELTYMNSNAIGLLVSFRRTLYVNGGRLAFSGVSDRIQRSLQTMRVTQLKICDTLEEAIDSVKA